jgi:membrane-bound lytic murein transglycosylase MltF
LSLTFERHVGDLDGTKKRPLIRVLVVPSHSGFFYAKGHPEGISYEAFDEFQRFANQKLKTGSLRINVTYIPFRSEQLENALLDGVGDVIGYGVIVTPEREQKVLFTAPIETNVKQVIVTGPKAPAIATLEDLRGKEIYANPLTVYYENLQHLSEAFQRAGQPPILVKAADPNQTDEDLREMVTAGLIPATVTINIRADFWSKGYPQVGARRNLVGGNQQIQEYVRYFQKYAAEYDFDYLMLVAQGYQESLLDQSKRNPSGAVDIMQVILRYAAAPPISLPNVDSAQYNIQAGAKMLYNIASTDFKDDKLDATNKTLMVFAAYNAGPKPNRPPEKGGRRGLDPNQ